MTQSFTLNRPSDRVRKKMKNFAEIFGNIIRKKVTIMQKRCQIMWKFLKLIELFPWHFPRYKICLTENFSPKNKKQPRHF